MRLVDIRTYPVKSLRGRSYRDAIVEPWGLAGDRQWLVIDEQGAFLTQRGHPLMATIDAEPTPAGLTLRDRSGRTLHVANPPPDAPLLDVTVWRDRIQARLASPVAAAFLTEALDTSCRLVRTHDPRARPVNPAYAPPGSVVSFADAYPVLLASLASLDELNRRLPAPIPMDRFRPNLVVDGALPFEEDTWRQVRVGDVLFAVVKPCDRCIVTTVDQQTGRRPDKTEPLRTLATFRQDQTGRVFFGQNLVPLTPGKVHQGDPITPSE